MTRVSSIIALFRRTSAFMLLACCLGASADVLVEAPATGSLDAGLENRLGLTFSPDGSAAYWTEWNGKWGQPADGLRTIYVSRFENGAWTPPRIAPFSGQFNDDDPFVSPDGEWVYFISDRPADASSNTTAGDIWRYRLTGEAETERLPVSSPAAEYSPVITDSGALYFASLRDGGYGKGDLYRAETENSGFGEPEQLGPAINSAYGEWNLWVSPDETEIVFEASSRPSNVSIPGDLYYSWKSASGWVPASPVGVLNSSASELMPRLHPDGKTLYFGQGKSGDHANNLQAQWPELRSGIRAGYAPLLMVANRSSHELTFVDLDLGRVVERIPTGAGPHLLSNVDNGRVLVTGYGVFPQPHDQPVSKRPPFVEDLNSLLSVIDISERKILREMSLAGCSRPHASWLAGQRAYVTCEDERYVLEVNVSTGGPVARFETQQAGSHVLSFDPATGLLAVSNTDSASATLIDVMSGETDVVSLASGSEGSRLINGQFWIANGQDGSVSVVDPHSAKEVRRIPDVCSFPIAFDVNAARDQVWLACFASAEIVSISTETFNITRRHATDAYPLHIAVHPNRDLAYLSMPRENALHEVDLQSGRTIRIIPVGIEPDGLRWIPPAD